MKQDDRFTVINIREYLKKNDDGEEQFGEDALRQLLSEFSCERNQDVEDFLKRQAINFTNKHQSVTYLVFATDDAQLLGYFALTIKPITVSGEPFSNTVRRKLSRVSTLNEKEHTYSLAAYLISPKMSLIKSKLSMIWGALHTTQGESPLPKSRGLLLAGQSAQAFFAAGTRSAAVTCIYRSLRRH